MINTGSEVLQRKITFLHTFL